MKNCVFLNLYSVFLQKSQGERLQFLSNYQVHITNLILVLLPLKNKFTHSSELTMWKMLGCNFEKKKKLLIPNSLSSSKSSSKIIVHYFLEKFMKTKKKIVININISFYF